jgi:pimeloyl-ACP methyl ester carboxylesterase
MVSLGRQRRRRRLLAALVVIVVVLGVGWLAVRDTSPVGHFRSAEAKDRFIQTYDVAMREMPTPDKALDLRTSFGIVRAYYFAGANPELTPLALLPGRASASPVWSGNLPSLLKVRSVYTLDLLGEPGMSVQDRPIGSEDDHARWLDEALARLPQAKFHLLGLSIGGWTAMNLAVHNPDRVASVSLLDPVFVFNDLSLQAILRSIPASVHWFPRSWRDGFSSWTAGGAPVEDVPVADMIEAGMQTYVLKLSPPQRIPTDRLAKLDVPVLAIMAGDSVMHDAAQAADTAKDVLSNGRVELYPNASHALNGEYPDEIAADVAAFLNSVEK